MSRLIDADKIDFNEAFVGASEFAHEAGSVDRQYLDEFDLEHYEVVGNIFDNKELLQEENK